MADIEGNKICFVICANNETLVNECQSYINRLWIPEGYEIETIIIREADSLTSAYNAAMNESNAKYKIYLHQDLFIVNRWFLYNILNIFNSDEQISLIGLAGTQNLADNAVFFQNTIIGRHWPCRGDKNDNNERPETVMYVEAVAVDGAIIVTSKDVRWREDIFDGFDYYDISESLEHRRAGYKVVIPAQNCAWCIHDDGSHMSLADYDKYRRRLLSEYDKSEFRLGSCSLVYDGENINSNSSYLEKVEDFGLNKEKYEANEEKIINEIDRILTAGECEKILSFEQELASKKDNKEIVMSGNLEIIVHIIRALTWEKKMNMKLFISDVKSSQELIEKYVQLKMQLRRIEFSDDDDFAKYAYRYIDENDISAYMVAEILFNKNSNYYKRIAILCKIADYYLKTDNKERSVHYLAQAKIHEERI